MRILSIDPGCKNLAVADLEKSQDTGRVSINSVDLVDLKAKGISAIVASGTKWLSTKLKDGGVSYHTIVIETQIGPNQTQKCLASALQATGVCHGVTVIFRTAYWKLKQIPGYVKKMPYRDRKKLAVRNFIIRISEKEFDIDEKIVLAFQDRKKQDDIADSCLQGYFYLLSR